MTLQWLIAKKAWCIGQLWADLGVDSISLHLVESNRVENQLSENGDNKNDQILNKEIV